MNYEEKNKLVNKIYAIRRELTELETLIWGIHEEAKKKESETQTHTKGWGQGT